jgi:hypothetical protein
VNGKEEEKSESEWQWRATEMEVIGKEPFISKAGLAVWPSDHFGVYASFVNQQSSVE